MRPSRGVTRLALAVGGAVVALLAAEAFLRYEGFQFRTVPTVQFGWPEPTTIAKEFVPDYDLLWTTPDYEEVLARARVTRPAIVFMGDSCTEFGTYPRLTLERLAASRSPIATGVRLGVAGWSTEQGLAQLRRDVLPLAPRVVTIYFGWNDHWVALGPPDAEARPSRAVWWLTQHARVAQLAEKYWLARKIAPSDRPNRVALSRFLENLETMARLVRGAGAVPILITAPSSHIRGREPKSLAARHLRRLEELVPLHQAYVEATRRAARLSGAALCDAAAAFAALPRVHGYFQKDGIHLSEAGNFHMAGLLVQCLAEATERSH